MDASNMLKPMLARGELHPLAPPRSTNTASTSKRMPRWSAASSRSSSASRRWKTRSPSCAACASATRSTTACIQGRRARRRGRPLESLHHRSLPARQGDRPDRRGGVAAAHGDRLDAGRARRDRSGASCSSRSSARRCARKQTRPRRSACSKLEKELADLKESSTGSPAHGSRRKTRSRARATLKEEIEQMRVEIERAQRAGDYAKAPSCTTAAARARAQDPASRRSRWREMQKRPAHAQGRSRRRRHRRGRQPWTQFPSAA